jgi:alpha-tubulin suppressor-like RCC1 family protein
LQSVVSIAAGDFHCAALTREGSIVCWGDNEYNKCVVSSDIEKVVAVSCGSDHTAVVLTNGQVICWGCTSSGQCQVPEELEAMTIGNILL